MDQRGLAAIGVCLACLVAPASRAQPASDHGLNGVWTTATMTPFDRPKELKALVLSEAEAAAYEKKQLAEPEKDPDDDVGQEETEWRDPQVGLARVRGQARSSWIVAPADGHTPFTVAAKAANKTKAERQKANFDDPEARPPPERCILDPATPLNSLPYNNGLQIIETPTAVVIQQEVRGYRVVHLDGGGHPPPSVRTRQGDAIGHWEGKTLVVETTNFAPTVVAAPNGDASADMRVVERFARLGSGDLSYSVLVSNPARYTEPVQAEMVFKASRERMFEFACHEGNYSFANVLAGARAKDGAGVSAPASR